jgi:hypothetical protein
LKPTAGLRCTSAVIRALATILACSWCVQPAVASDPWAKLRRPLHVPRIASGRPCPVTPPTRGDIVFGTRQGPGPVYPIGGLPEFRFLYPVKPTQVYYASDWSGNKVLWVARSYRGPLLIRGRQLDGSHELRFGQARNPARELRWTSVGGSSPTGWQNHPSTTRVRSSGCYAWQVDGTTFSRVIIFRAVRLPGS